MADYSALAVTVVADTRQLTRQIGQAATGAGLNAAKSIGNTVSTGFAVATTAAVGFGAAVIKSGISYNTLAQTSNAAFKTILGSQKAATKMMDDLSAFAKSSPFPRQAFIQGAQQMLSFGVPAQKVIGYMGAIQDAVAAAGGSSQQLSDVIFVMSQIQAAGKITGQDLMQLGQRGINAADLIGKQMGKTGPQIKKMITDGALPAGKALDALAAGMKQKFGGAAANVKQTWTGAMDRVKGAMRDMGSVIVEPFISKQGGGIALDFANKFADTIRAAIPAVTGFMSQIMAKITPYIPKILALFDRITGALKGKVDIGAMFGGLGDVAKTLAPIVALFGAKGFGNLAGALGPLGGLLPKINPLLGAVVALVATTPELQSAFKDVFKSLKPLMPVIGQLAQVLGGALSEAAVALAPVISDLGRTLGTVLGSAAQALVPIIGRLGPIIGKLAQVAGAILTPILDALSPVLGAVGQAIDMVLAALQPLLPSLIKMGSIIGNLIGRALLAVLPLLKPVAQILVALIGIIEPLLPLITMLADVLSAILVPAINLVVTVLKYPIQWLAVLTQAVAAGVAAVIGWFMNLSTTAPKFFANLYRSVTGWMKNLVTSVVRFVSGLFSSVTGWFSRMWSTVSGAVSRGVSTVIRWFAGLPARAMQAIGGLASRLLSFGGTLMHNLLSGITNGAKAIFDFFGNMLSTILGRLGDVTGWAYNVGKSIVTGIISGIGNLGRSIADKVIGGLKSLGKKVLGFLGIGSPSKWYAEMVGLPIAQGIAVGAEKGQPLVDKAVLGLAQIPKVSPWSAMSPSQTVGLGVAGAARGGATINVYPQPRQSETEIAAAVNRSLAWATSGGAA